MHKMLQMEPLSLFREIQQTETVSFQGKQGGAAPKDEILVIHQISGTFSLRQVEAGTTHTHRHRQRKRTKSIVSLQPVQPK